MRVRGSKYFRGKAKKEDSQTLETNGIGSESKNNEEREERRESVDKMQMGEEKTNEAEPLKASEGYDEGLTEVMVKEVEVLAFEEHSIEEPTIEVISVEVIFC